MTSIKISRYSFSTLKSTISATGFTFSRSSSITLAVEDQDELVSGLVLFLNRVFVYLSVSDLLICGLVNREWRKTTHLPKLWQKYVIHEEIPIGPQWNYLLEIHEKDTGYAWKMLYFQHHRQMRHWNEINYYKKSIHLSNNQQIKW